MCKPVHVWIYPCLKVWEITQKCQQTKSRQIPGSFSPSCFCSVAVHLNLICQYTNSSPLFIMSACLHSDCMGRILTRGIFAEWLIESRKPHVLKTRISKKLNVILGMNKYELAVHLWSECNGFLITKVSLWPFVHKHFQVKSGVGVLVLQTGQFLAAAAALHLRDGFTSE